MPPSLAFGWSRLEDPRFRRKVLAAILLAAFVLRVGYRVMEGSDAFWSGGYAFFYEYAKNIVAGKGLWVDGGGWAMRPPVYPFFLVPAALFGGNYLFIVVPQALIGAGTVACAYGIARELFSRTAGLAAALLTAIYPYYVVHDTALQETGLLTFIASLSVYLLLRARTRRSPVLLATTGVALGAAVLVRTSILPFVPGAVLWLAFFSAPPWRNRVLRASIAGLAASLVIGAWLVRNEAVIGSPVLSSETGYQFWTAHNGKTFSRYPRASMDRSRNEAFAALSEADRREIATLEGDELAYDAWFARRGWDYVKAHPGETITGAAVKLATGFSPILNPGRPGFGSVVYTLSYAPLLILAVCGMVLARRRWRIQSVIYLQFAAFVLVSAVYWAHTSHRVHLDVYLAVFAGFTLTRLARYEAYGTA